MYFTFTVCRHSLKHCNNSGMNNKNIPISWMKYLRTKEVNHLTLTVALNNLQKNVHSILWRTPVAHWDNELLLSASNNTFDIFKVCSVT